MSSIRIGLAASILALVVAGCSREPTRAPGPAPTEGAVREESWSGFVDRFIESRMQADPHFAVQSGRHEFDGRMPDWSRAAIDADIAALREQLGELSRQRVTRAQEFERDYIQWIIESEIFWLETAAAPFRNPAWYLERLDPSMYLTREYAPLQKRLEGFLGYARAVPGLAAGIRENLRTPLPKAFIEHAIAGFSGYAEFFREEMPRIFADLPDERLKADLGSATALAAQAMSGLATWLESQRATGTGDFALGAALFREMLRVTEHLDVPLEELELLGRKDLERNLAALEEACASFAPRATLAACVSKMRANKPAGGPVEGARAQLAALRQFVVDHDIVGIPGDEQASVAESPPYNRGNFAYISIPGPYEKRDARAIYYVAPPDPSWSAAERRAYLPGSAFLLFVSAHEVWPGHFLQFQVANASPSRLPGLWSNYSYTEGWAHYAEEMMYDAGLGARQPEMRVGMLANALLRDVRFLSAICLHSGCMDLAESESMFRELAFADAGNARQQALRGTYDPGYLAYTLGKLMIRKLCSDWLAANPGATPRRFHDEFLSFGSPPLPLVRKQMLGSAAGAL
jgi:hypothetical protein